MVAVKDQHGPLVPLGQLLDQLSHKGVHFVDLIDIILHGIAVFLIRTGLHCNGRILQLLLHGIFAVSLHRHREHQVCLVLRHIQRLEDLIFQHAVLGPVGGGLRHCGHILQGGEIVKAQVRIDLVPAVERRPVVVDGVGGIAVGLQVKGHRLHGLVRQACLEGILARPEKPGTHAGEDLKFRIGRSSAHHRHSQVAGGILLLQRRPVGHRVL